LLNDGFEGGDWDGNWGTNSWYRSTYNHGGSFSAAALNGKEGTFTSDPMDASDAASITVDFWFMKMATDTADYTLYFYDGSSYVLIDELDDNGGDYSTWLHYMGTTTDSRYFTSGFRVRLDATLGSGEQAWLDDVLVTKETGGTPPPTGDYTLTTNIVGQGQINANPSGPYDSGTTVTLTAVPASGWEFSGWGGALLASGTTNPATLQMTQDRWVQATFTEAQITTVILLDDGFEGGDWDGNWGTNSWYRSTYEHTGSYTAAARNGYAGAFTSDPLNTGDAVSITVDFWFMKLATDSADYTLYFYDGSGYVLIDELDDNGGDYPTWIHYTYTTTNSRYFTSSFRIRLDATLASGEQAWLDDVLITKEAGGTPPPPPPGQYTLTTNVVGQGQVNVNPTGPYDSGTVVTLTAVPASGWEFSGWSGALSGSTNPTSINMNANKWVQATFTQGTPPPPPPPSDDIMVRYRKDNIGSLSNTQLREIAETTDLVVTMPYSSNVNAMNYLRTINPDIRILAYENVWAVDDRTSDINIARSNGWILKDRFGNEIYARNWQYNKICDVGNQGYRNWLADRIKSHMDNFGFDGIMADNTRAIIDSTYGVSADPINPRTGSVFTSTQWRDAMVGNVQTIRGRMGSKIYIGNGLGALTGSLPNGFWANEALVAPLIDAVNGMMMEGFIRWENEGWRTESNWVKDVDFLEYMSQRGKMSVALVNAYGNLAAPLDQITMYGLCSYLLGQSGSGAYFSVSGSAILEMGNVLEANVGTPTELYHKRSGTSVYEREYTDALILVNPTSSNSFVNLGGTYRIFEGGLVTSITVSAHTGVILLEP
jgi:hypothetical protein